MLFERARPRYPLPKLQIAVPRTPPRYGPPVPYAPGFEKTHAAPCSQGGGPSPPGGSSLTDSNRPVRRSNITFFANQSKSDSTEQPGSFVDTAKAQAVFHCHNHGVRLISTVPDTLKLAQSARHIRKERPAGRGVRSGRENRGCPTGDDTASENIGMPSGRLLIRTTQAARLNGATPLSDAPLFFDIAQDQLRAQTMHGAWLQAGNVLSGWAGGAELYRCDAPLWRLLGPASEHHPVPAL